MEQIKFLSFLTYTAHLLGLAYVRLGIYNGDEGWISKHGSKLGSNRFDMYVAAYYMVIETFTTVGYGDLGGVHESEFLLLMLI